MTGPAYDFCLRSPSGARAPPSRWSRPGTSPRAWLDAPSASRARPRRQRGAGVSAPLLVGNCSGFYGDRLGAMRELLTGDPVPAVVTGDYLAELTMLILGRTSCATPLGYAPHVRAPGRGLPRPAARARRPARRQRGRAAPRPASRAPARGGRRSRASTSTSRTSRVTTCGTSCGPGTWTRIPPAHRQRLPRRRRHHAALAAGATSCVTVAAPTPRSWSGPRPGTTAGPTTTRPTSTPGRRDRRRPRPGVRDPCHRRQLLGLPRPAPRPTPLGFPLAEVAADGSAWSRRRPAPAGSSPGTPYRAAALRGAVGPLRHPGRRRPPRHGAAGRRRPGPVRVSEVVGEAPPRGSRCPSTRWAACAQPRGPRAHRTRPRREGGVGTARSSSPACGPPRSPGRAPRCPTPTPTPSRGVAAARCTVRPREGARRPGFTAAVVELALGSYPGSRPSPRPPPPRRTASTARPGSTRRGRGRRGPRRRAPRGRPRRRWSVAGSRGSGPGGPRASTSGVGHETR